MPDATPEEIARLVEDLDRGRQAWIEGRLEETATISMVQDDDMTIYGPFGGDASWNGPEFAARQPRIAGQFEGGAGRCELVKAMASGDLVVLVMLERNEVRFLGRSTPEPWILRTTQVFRRDGDRWLRLHRHADPLIRFRPLAETLAIAALR